jgi:hypothetical protein
VKVLPLARRSVTSRVVKSMAVTVADAVTTRDALAVPGPRSITVPLDGCPMAGEASTVATRTATRPH